MTNTEPKRECCGKCEKGDVIMGRNELPAGKVWCCDCSCHTVGVDYSRLSHSHCWDQGTPACGIPLKDHKQCCLCEEKPPAPTVQEECTGCTTDKEEGTHQLGTKQHPEPVETARKETGKVPFEKYAWIAEAKFTQVIGRLSEDIRFLLRDKEKEVLTAIANAPSGEAHNIAVLRLASLNPKSKEL